MTRVHPELKHVSQKRHIVRLLREIAHSLELQFSVDVSEWTVGLVSGTTRRHVVGFDFDLNAAGSSRLANDKSVLSAVLAANGVPAVPHHLFINPQLTQYVPESGNWQAMLEFAAGCDWNVICKPNDGTGGRDVLHVKTPRDLELGSLRLFQHHNALAMCPFVDIAHEFRVIMLEGEAVLQYEKIRPSVTGDGRRRVVDLLAAQESDSRNFERLSKILRNLDPEVAARLRRVPQQGEEVPLNWRHNLGQGSFPKLSSREDIVPLARNAACVANLSFCSVDIVVPKDGEMQVLEINAGVMMEAFIDLVPGGEDIARSVYERAVRAMFGRYV